MKRLLLAAMITILAACSIIDKQEAGGSMQGKTVYIVHGYSAGPRDHWFDWLASQISGEGGVAHVVSLPDSGDPDPDAWDRALRAQIPDLGPDTYIVAHSLGTIATLRFLDGQSDRLEDRTIGGFILVSGFDGALPGLPELDAFVAREEYDPDRITRIAPARTVVLSQSDTIVPPDLSRALARKLDASLVEVADAGHFLGSEGYRTLPQVWSALQAQIAPR